MNEVFHLKKKNVTVFFPSLLRNGPIWIGITVQDIKIITLAII